MRREQIQIGQALSYYPAKAGPEIHAEHVRVIVTKICPKWVRVELPGGVNLAVSPDRLADQLEIE